MNVLELLGVLVEAEALSEDQALDLTREVHRLQRSTLWAQRFDRWFGWSGPVNRCRKAAEVLGDRLIAALAEAYPVSKGAAK